MMEILYSYSVRRMCISNILMLHVSTLLGIRTPFRTLSDLHCRSRKNEQIYILPEC